MKLTPAEDSAPPKKEKTAPAPEPLSQITFPNGHTARLNTMPVDAAPDDFLERLNVSAPKALIIMTGGTEGFDEHLKSRMYQFFTRGIVRAASKIDALILDGGTLAEGMATMDDIQNQSYPVPLIGMAPVSKVTYPGAPKTDGGQEKAPLNPDHSHFILTDTPDWGGAIELMYRVVEYLRTANDIPVITVLVNGQKLARAQVLRSVRMGSPVIVFKGSGGLADDIAEFYEKPPEFIESPELAEIVQEGDIRLCSVESSLEALERLISQQVRRDSMLKLAWRQFGVYDLNAVRHQCMFQRIQNAIIWLGVVGTTLALTQANIKVPALEPSLQKSLHDILHYMITAVPILVAILLAAANEFKSGNKWLHLRSSAELLKSEIFHYRTQTETSISRQIPEETREIRLAKKLKQISTQLMQTDVNLSALKAYTGPLPPVYGTKPGDDGFSMLSPENYLDIRLEDQLGFYVGKTAKLEKRLRRLEWLVYIVGGVGTMLAAFNMELWVALTGALVAAFGTHMKYEMLQETLTKYNQAAVALTNVRSWWISLSAAEQAKKTNITMLIENTEGILRSEFSSWIQEMQDTIAALQKEEPEQETDDDREDNTIPAE